MASTNLESLRKGDREDIITVKRTLTYSGRRFWVVSTLEKGAVPADAAWQIPGITPAGQIKSEIELVEE